MILYGLKNCDTCRKALKVLPNAELADVSVAPVPEDILIKALDAFGENLINTRSTTWRGLDDEARKTPPLELLQAHPKLMKRPLIDADGGLYLGWTKETQTALGV